ncbi:hypothetical protein E0Z10_g54 [Xylaria hypoxylon]|uniref:BTB domain-containing protein n=1 Tax=Xylaria hypoxylon TaxID=37992 RepID=A0A4Z0ZAA3_9PEZI|nr:hypothetical protein E0Z10_g54 [Xylaria hypoxylon]
MNNSITTTAQLQSMMASMAETTTILDPDADILVILRNPKRIQPLVFCKESDFSEPESSELESNGIEWYFQSSSKRLASASPRFEKMMNGPWREATEVHAVEVACLVDYIGCYEVIKHYASIWIRHLEDKVPESYNDELFLWICIAGVFHESAIFKRCTRTAILGHHDGIDMPGLPILPEISDEITRLQISHLDKIFDHIYGRLDDLATGLECCFTCDAGE